MEVVVGISTILLFWKYRLSGELIIVGFFLLLMLLVAVIDWQHLIIPNEVLLAGIVIGLAIKLLLGHENTASDIVSAISAFAVVSAIRFLGSAYFKKEAMGMGDVKLAALIGFFLGWQLFLLSLWFAAVGGSIYGIARSGKGIRIPFGSFMAATSAIVMIFRDEVSQLLVQYFSP